ncbi:MAG TPA: tetratricopeptide repeat protein [Thermoanaerobaculia bacterium]|nr:tetratricopeptide repeat protein [Thermoanaerobaculia bacterium]
MTYPGNASLAGAVKDRVMSTFQQTLALYHQGRRDEVAAGCNLILQMDPTFEPARKLLEKSRNPAAPIDVDNLVPRDTRAPMEQARAAMAERDFQRVIQITTDVLTDDLLNDEARILGDEAREKMEASPFVEQFARKCDQAIASGNLGGAKLDLEKARALDPTHPEVIRVGKAIAQRDSAASAAPPTSFIVDDKPAPSLALGRSTAQAADFGFSFEEEKPAEPSFANFSFDSPAQPFSFDAPATPAAPKEDAFSGFSFETPSVPAPMPAPEPASGGFDFATASVVTSSDDQKKIDQYLADGDRAAAAGDYQQAIDLWSRIFLIDVTNDQASERIEKAKAKRRETEQKTETLLASGIAAFERGDTARAHADLSEVLRLDPHHATAQEYLDRLNETVVEGGAAAKAAPFIPPTPSSADKLDLGFFEDDGGALSEAPLMPPDPGAAIPAPSAASGKRAAATPAAKTERKLPVGLIAAVLAVLVFGAGGYFAWTRFMNKPQAEDGAGSATLARASALASAGKYDQAIALLQDIKPSDPEHDRALVMIADLQAKKNSSAQMIDGIPAAQFYDQRVAAAQTAFDAHDFATAKSSFEQAMRVKPLPPDMKANYDTAAQQVAKLDAAKALFAERKYSDAISNLQPLLDQDPSNQNVKRLIVDAHFNLGAQALQEERVQDAVKEFDEVLKVTPEDDLAKRSRELALRYDGEPKDLLYKIYVKYLPTRQPV